MKRGLGVFRTLLFAVMGLLVASGCALQTYTDVTIAPELQTTGFFVSGENTDLSAGLVDYSTLSAVPTTVSGDAPVITPSSSGGGTLYFGFNQLLNGDTIEDVILKQIASVDIPNGGNGDWAGFMPFTDHWEGKANLVEVWVSLTPGGTLTQVTSSSNSGVFNDKKVNYRPEGLLPRAYNDPFSKYYNPAMVLVFSGSPSAVPAAALPAGADVMVHVLTSTSLTDGVGFVGVSGLKMAPAVFSDGTTVVTSSTGNTIAATVMFKTAP